MGLHVAKLVKESAIAVEYEFLIIVLRLRGLLCLCKEVGA